MQKEKRTRKKRSRTVRLEEELETARADLKDYHERYLRALADLENFKKRTIKDRQEYVDYANANIIGALLTVLDNFERALDSGKSVDEVEPFYKGVKMIYDELKQILEKEGLEQVVALGEEFNPERHEAVVAIESGDHPPNIVIDEIEKGYILKNRVIRHSKVAVSKNKEREVK